MAEAQGHKCAICKQTPNHTLHADHNHATGEVRGLLCRQCNLALGGFKDSITNLSAAIAYIKQGNKNVV